MEAAMKFLVEVPDEQIYRGVPRDGAAEYIARAKAAAAEQARQCIARSIRFQTPFVPTVSIDGEPVEAAAPHISFEEWLAIVREEAWKEYSISKEEANALGLLDPAVWRSFYGAGNTPADALADYFAPVDPSTIQPGEVQAS
jgi:hypothetical protein